MFLIDDINYIQFQPDETGTVKEEGGGGERRFCSAIPRDWTKNVYGSVGVVDPPVPIVKYDEWPERIAERKAKGLTNKDLFLRRNLPVLDQDGLNYCHAYAAVTALMFARARANLPFVELSAGSVGGPITNFRNEGAWIGNDLKRIRDVGASTTAFVPMDQVSRNGWKPGAEENCQHHRAIEIWELRSRDLLQQGSTLLAGHVNSIGLIYWGHAVVDFDPVDLHPGARIIEPDRFGIEFLNSWGLKFGEQGWAVRTGNKKYADEAYVVRTVTLSEQ